MANNKVELSNGTTLMDITDTTATESDVVNGQVFYKANGVRSTGTANYIPVISNPTQDDILIDDGNGNAVDSGVDINDVVTFLDVATGELYGLVKLNPNESIGLNANGQLTVGGRVGQFSSQAEPNGGLYYPTTITPELVKSNSFLITEATGTAVTANRIFALAGGANVTLKSSAPAGSTTYYVNNTFANRFTCASFLGGWVTIDQANAGILTVKVSNIYYENDTEKKPLVPNSNATESNNRIVIETETSANPDSATTKLRGYGSMTFDSSVFIGQSVGTGGVTGKGKLLQLGQSQTALDGNSIMVGNAMFSSKNRVALFGASHINHVQGAFMGGEGHDSTDGTFVGLGAIGKYSNITSNSAFVIGNGTANTARSNLFEITDNGSIKTPTFEANNRNGATELKMISENGTEHFLTVTNDGQIQVLSPPDPGPITI